VKRLLALVLLPPLLSACAECAGTPSCHNHPEISYSGQFIERKTGAPVGNVSVKFVRRSGIDIIGDTIRGQTDGDGFFTLRAGSIYNGAVIGDLIVTPPLPFPAFTISGVTIETSRVRGDGRNAGRFVVNPYMLLVGHVRDRKTLTPLVDATVTMKRIGGGRVEADERTFTTDFGGQFSWEPAILEPATVEAVFEITAPGYARTFMVQRDVPLQYRDGEMAFVILPVGYGLAYSGTTARRGSGDQVPGVKVEFVRTGGIAIQPAQVELTPDPAGSFILPLEPLAEGTVIAQLRILPPTTIRPETVTVALTTSDDDTVEWLGFFGYGAQVLVKAELRDAVTDERLPSSTGVTMQRTGGVQLAWSNPLPDGDLLAVGDSGRISYNAPTADSGTVSYDMIVRHPAPFRPDTIRNLTFPARYSDSAYVAGVIPVRRRPAP